jgi:phage terminase small subunit
MTASVRKVPKPPAHLSRAARKWWSDIMAAYEIEDHAVAIVTAAAEAWDRKEAARKVLAVEGMTITCRDGAKTHPCVGIERDSRLAFLRAVRELCLSAEDPDDSRVAGLHYPGRRY